jgi:hypothetical protein
MSDRINTITVVLEKETRLDDSDAIIAAIRMTKGVLSAAPNVNDPFEYTAFERARHELRQELREVLYPKLK